MSEDQLLKDPSNLQLTPADEGIIADQGEEKNHLKEENKRDMQPLLAIKEENPQKRTPSVDQEDDKEEEKLWISQQGEHLQQLEEADLSKFGLTVITVKSESDDEKPESSSKLNQSQSDDITEAEPVASSSSEHRTLTAEDYGGPQPVSNSGPNSHLQPDTSGWSSDSSGTETDDSYDWKQTTELQSHFNCQKNINIVSSINCNIVEKQFKSSKYVKATGQHKGRQRSGKLLSCLDHGERKKEKVTLNKHRTIHTEQKQFVCSECGRIFSHKSRLKTHIVIHTGQKPFICSDCGQRFSQKGTLNRHRIIHTGQKQFSCSECGQRFGRKSSLNAHMIIHTGQKPFGCSECGQRFRRKSTLNVHMMIHTEHKPFGCSECGQRFGQKSSLNGHKIIHTGQKQFCCSICGHRFGRKSNLREHMIIHTGQKPFGCSECVQRFRLKSTLVKHMIIHTGQKQFGCSECVQRFRLKSTLDNHMVIHTGQRPFGCSECSQRFGRNSTLNRHMKIHATSSSATGSSLSCCASNQLDNPPDHDPGPATTISQQQKNLDNLQHFV